MRNQTGLMCVVVAMLTALVGGCLSTGTTAKKPFLTQSAAKSADPLEREKPSESVACKH